MHILKFQQYYLKINQTFLNEDSFRRICDHFQPIKINYCVTYYFFNLNQFNYSIISICTAISIPLFITKNQTLTPLQQKFIPCFLPLEQGTWQMFYNLVQSFSQISLQRLYH